LSPCTQRKIFNIPPFMTGILNFDKGYMHYTWLALIAFRHFSTPFGIPSILLTVGINAFLFLHLLIKLSFQKNFYMQKILLISVPYIFLLVFNNNALHIINILVACYLLSDIKIERIVIFNTMLFILFFLLLFFGIWMGFILNERFSIAYKGGEYAYEFGFQNPNVAAIVFLHFVILLFYLGCRYKLVLLHFVCIAISVIVYRYTGARTSFYAIIILFILTVIFYSFEFLKKIKPLLLFIPLLSMLLLLIGVLMIDHPLVIAIDMIITNRIYFSHMFLNELSLVNIFIGKPLPEDIIVDQFYLAMLAHTGIMAVIVFYFLYIKFILNENIRKGYIFSIVIAILFFGLVESTFFGISATGLPLFWLLFFKSAYNKREIII